ncbi:MAG: SMI1/KNR4 family protein [Acidobacteriota bacterium]
MPFPVQERYIEAVETKLGVKLPQDYRQKLMRENGGELALPPDHWELFPVLDTSHKKRLKRTCNDIVLETKNSQKWAGFPPQGVAIGTNGGGDKLVFMPSASDPLQLAPDLLRWDHETGRLHRIPSTLDELFPRAE